MTTFIIQQIKYTKTDLPASEAQDMLQRLYELGLRPGIEIAVIRKVSFGSVTIIQFGQTRLALNQQEMLCLHGPS